MLMLWSVDESDDRLFSTLAKMIFAVLDGDIQKADVSVDLTVHQFAKRIGSIQTHRVISSLSQVDLLFARFQPFLGQLGHG